MNETKFQQGSLVRSTVSSRQLFVSYCWIFWTHPRGSIPLTALHHGGISLLCLLQRGNLRHPLKSIAGKHVFQVLLPHPSLLPYCLLSSFTISLSLNSTQLHLFKVVLLQYQVTVCNAYAFRSVCIIYQCINQSIKIIVLMKTISIHDLITHFCVHMYLSVCSGELKFPLLLVYLIHSKYDSYMARDLDLSTR